MTWCKSCFLSLNILKVWFCKMFKLLCTALWFLLFFSPKMRLIDFKNRQRWYGLVFMGESAQLAPSSSFYVVSSAMLTYKSFKIRINLLMILIKIYKGTNLTSFFDFFGPLSIRCSSNLQLRSAHEKPQQLNRFDSPIDADLPERCGGIKDSK